MSSYLNECPDCGDEYRTYGWIPDKCPFCESTELEKKLDEARRLATEYRDAYAKHFKDGDSDIASLPWENEREQP